MPYTKQSQTYIRETDQGQETVVFEPKKPGPQEKEIDGEQIKRLASIFCTMEEICLIMQISKDTLSRRFQDVYNEGRAHGKMSLRRQQMKAALDGNVGLMVWLGKQVLGQSEKIDQRSIAVNLEAGQNSEIKEHFMKVLGTGGHLERKGIKKTVIESNEFHVQECEENS